MRLTQEAHYPKCCEVVDVSVECKDFIPVFIKICCRVTFENNNWVNPVSAVSGLIPQMEQLEFTRRHSCQDSVGLLHFCAMPA